MRRTVRLTAFVLCLLTPLLLLARLRDSPGQEDIRDLADHAPMVFRGQVVQLDLTRNDSGRKEGIAVIEVDRWYHGGNRTQGSSRVSIHFAYGSMIMGHDCVDLVMDSHWIFFAKPLRPGVLELFHDCNGALAISPLLAEQTLGTKMSSQIEVDFRAGLSDSDPRARLASIQRLAGLGLPASREALHIVISQGTAEESKWALFAAVKTGDASAVKLAVPVLVNFRREKPGPYPEPDGPLAVAVEKVRDPAAVPALIEILNKAPDDLIRSCASAALMEIKDPRALDALAEHLSDQSQYVRYNSLIGMGYITHAPACTIATPEDAEKTEPLCKAWWGSKR